MKKIFFLTLPVLILLILTTDTVSAVGPGNFVTCNGTDCSACNFVEMVNKIIKWLFGMAFVVFAVLMAKAGFGLVTSGGSESALASAKSHFQNAIIGLIIMMAAWLIVDTLMRGLLDGGTGEIKGYGPWSQVQCQIQSRPVVWAGDPADVGPSAPAGPVAPLPGAPAATCTGAACVPIGIPCKPGANCNISPDLVDNLQAMHAAAGVAGAYVTEGMPPTRTHQSLCHTNGTCIDYSKPGGMTSAEVVSVINAANANGLRPVYEVHTQAQMDTLVAAGAPAANIKVLGTWISAPHFSIYGY